MPVIVVYSVNLSCNCLWKYWSKWYIRSIFKSSKPFWKCQPKWHIWSILRKAPSLFGNAIQSGILGQSCKVLTSKCLWKCWSDRVHKKHFQLKNRCKLPWLFKCERWFYLQHCLKAQSMTIRDPFWKSKIHICIPNAIFGIHFRNPKSIFACQMLNPRSIFEIQNLFLHAKCQI